MPEIVANPPDGPSLAAILFDEGHGQGLWFSSPPTVDKGYSQAAALAGQRGRVAFAPSGRRFSQASLAGYTILVLAMGPQGQTQLTDDELETLHGFVRGGGGLLVLGAYTGDWHHQANLNRLIESYGITFNRDVVLPAGARPDDGFVQGGNLGRAMRCVVNAFPSSAANRVQNLLDKVGVVAALSSCSLYVDEGMASPVLQASPDSILLEPEPAGAGIHIQGYIERGQGPAVLVAAATTAKVVVAGSWRLFLDAFMADPRYANRQLFSNILDWLATGPASGQSWPAAAASAAGSSAAPGNTPSSVDDSHLRTLEDRLRRRRSLLNQLEKDVVLAIGLERATLNVHIDEVKQGIASDEAEIDALRSRG